MPWRQNDGRIPPETEIRGDDGDITGHRNVHVRLRCGFDSQKAGHAPWPAGGRQPGTRWTLRQDSHDILEWELA